MTKEDWKKVEEGLKSQFKSVSLKCDGYIVSLSLRRIDTMKLGIAVYVNGWFRGEWFVKELSEEARRFFPSRYKAVYSVKEKKFYGHYPFGKKYCKEHNINLSEKREMKGFFWTSVTALKRHFIKHNKEIELVEE